MKINMPISVRVAVKYEDLEDNCSGIIFGKLTNIFNGLIGKQFDYNQEEVAGLFVKKWIENGKELNIEKGKNDRVNIFKQDKICLT